ncbi:PH domain-containing protein [Streptomyces sp. B1I3]|uniref:PH domain-containing protein n=1 Tax=Streptomyces sp. B1I3 TaxID=3042264 RepID=UPI0027D88D82|nr:PH domain-containing protein [Streptomyces sp. B1I3]
MTDVREMSRGPVRNRALWFFVVLGAAGALLAVVRTACRGGPVDGWVFAGALLALPGLVCLHAATAEIGADAHGLRTRTLLRRRCLPWRDVADLGVDVRYGRNQEIHRVVVMLRDGRRRRLPLPVSGSSDDRPAFDADLDALRALHRRHGVPRSSHIPVISYRSAGRGPAVSLCLCALLVAGAGLAAWFVPVAEEERAAWASAVPCTAGTPAAERGECLTTLPAVIARAEDGRGKRGGQLHFTDGRPVDRLAVSKEGARGFGTGDHVELTVWRGQVREVAGEHHVWREHFAGPGELAVVAAGCLLCAGYPGARALLHRRGRRLPDDEVLPSALPFAGALAGTALWLLPLCHLHPVAPFASPATRTWAGCGSAVTLALFTWAWYATRVRTPQDTADVRQEVREEEFLAARFLDHTGYNPNGFGTHIVLGGGPPAVTPHPGPGRFAARRIPVERLTVTAVRRARGSDGDSVPRSWHIAEIDDAGEPVRLAAAPADLARVIGELGRPRTAPDAGRPRR